MSIFFYNLRIPQRVLAENQYYVIEKSSIKRYIDKRSTAVRSHSISISVITESVHVSARCFDNCLQIATSSNILCVQSLGNKQYYYNFLPFMNRVFFGLLVQNIWGKGPIT